MISSDKSIAKLYYEFLELKYVFLTLLDFTNYNIFISKISLMVKGQL